MMTYEELVNALDSLGDDFLIVPYITTDSLTLIEKIDFINGDNKIKFTFNYFACPKGSVPPYITFIKLGESKYVFRTKTILKEKNYDYINEFVPNMMDATYDSYKINIDNIDEIKSKLEQYLAYFKNNNFDNISILSTLLIEYLKTTFRLENINSSVLYTKKFHNDFIKMIQEKGFMKPDEITLNSMTHHIPITEYIKKVMKDPNKLEMNYFDTVYTDFKDNIKNKATPVSSQQILIDNPEQLYSFCSIIQQNSIMYYQTKGISDNKKRNT